MIDVTELFTSDLPEFSAGGRLDAQRRSTRAKTFIEQVKSFPRTSRPRSLMTYRRGGGGRSDRAARSRAPAARRRRRGGDVTVLLHHSMVKLPEEPMKPRKYDDRVGFFTETFQDYGDITNHQVENVQYITRWRLEKKDPKAEVSEPKKPIVFYIGREVPDKWRPWIKKGVEAWQPAFEKAGFKNAIIAKDAPTPREDPTGTPRTPATRRSAGSPRPSRTPWARTSTTRGPARSSRPTSCMYHNILKLIRDWYFVQASPNDPRAQKLPLPDDLIGELLAYVIAHEVGHTLGFQHNMKASSSFTVAQLRDPKFTKENGDEASIMDYGRFNYVAQPGDDARLIPIIGPYDKFAVEWGYKEFPDAETYEQEKAKLDEIVARQIKDPTLRFGDPNRRRPLAADRGPRLRRRRAPPSSASRTSTGSPATSSRRPRRRARTTTCSGTCTASSSASGTASWCTSSPLVGGSVETNLWFGDADSRYDPVPGDQQKKAIAFLNDHAFQTPASLIAPDILDRLEANGAADRILSAQTACSAASSTTTAAKRMAEQVGPRPEGGLLAR